MKIFENGIDSLEGMSPLERLRSISGTRHLATLRERVDETQNIIPGLLPSGSLTMFYAKPNAGKTLFVLAKLIESIELGRLHPSKLFYINEDDNAAGFLEKSELAHKHGFEMISSVQSTSDAIRNTQDIVRILAEIPDSGESEGLVIVVDTLTKLADVLDPNSVKRFTELLRKLNAGGATVILLAHANKNKNEDGNIVFKGVQDLVDNVDNSFSIQIESDRTASTQVCVIRCEKDRGAVDREQTFEYKKNETMSYAEIMASVKVIEGDELEAQRIQSLGRRGVAKYKEAWGFLHSILSDGTPRSQSEILAALKEVASGQQKLAENSVKRAINVLNGSYLKVEYLRHENNKKMIALNHELVEND